MLKDSEAVCGQDRGRFASHDGAAMVGNPIAHVLVHTAIKFCNS